jgi:hypothetical protein
MQPPTHSGAKPRRARGADHTPMFAQATARKTAWMRAMQSTEGRTCVRSKGFCNALGGSFVAEMMDSAQPGAVWAISPEACAQAHALAGRQKLDTDDAAEATEAVDLTDMVRLQTESGTVSVQQRADLTGRALIGQDVPFERRKEIMAKLREEGVLPEIPSSAETACTGAAPRVHRRSCKPLRRQTKRCSRLWALMATVSRQPSVRPSRSSS